MTDQKLPLITTLIDLATEYHNEASKLTNELLYEQNEDRKELIRNILLCESRFENLMVQIDTLHKTNSESLATFEAYDFLRYLHSTLENLQMYNGFYDEAADFLSSMEDLGLSGSLLNRRLSEKLAKMELKGVHLPYCKKNKLTEIHQEIEHHEHLSKDWVTEQFFSKRCTINDIVSFMTYCKSETARIEYLKVEDEWLTRTTNGYLELVKGRNSLANSLGYSDYVELVDVVALSGSNSEEIIRSYLRNYEVKCELLRLEISTQADVSLHHLSMRHNQYFYVEKYAKTKLMELGVSHVDYSGANLCDFVQCILSELPCVDYTAHSNNHVTISTGSKLLTIRMYNSDCSEVYVDKLESSNLESTIIVSRSFESVIQKYRECRRIYREVYNLILEIMPPSISSETCPLSIQLSWQDIETQKKLVKKNESETSKFANLVTSVDNFIFYNDCALALDEIEQYRSNNTSSPSVLFQTQYDAALVLGERKTQHFANIAMESSLK